MPLSSSSRGERERGREGREPSSPPAAAAPRRGPPSELACPGARGRGARSGVAGRPKLEEAGAAAPFPHHPPLPPSSRLLSGQGSLDVSGVRVPLQQPPVRSRHRVPPGRPDPRRSRAGVALSTPMSPALAALASHAPDRVAARTAEGRRLRRQALKGAVVVFVTAGYSGKRFIFERAAELGVRSIVLDGPDSWAQTLGRGGHCGAFRAGRFRRRRRRVGAALAALATAKRDVGEIDGVVTFCELAVPLVSRLAERLGLAGKLAGVRRRRADSRRRGASGGGRGPRPAVVPHRVHRPTGRGGRARGVPRGRETHSRRGVDRRRAGERRGRPARRLWPGAKGDGVGDDCGGGAAAREGGGGEEGGDGAPADPSTAAWIKTTLMLEEYLDGPEVDVDLVFSEGAPVICRAVTDNWPTVEPYFNETGSNCPSTCPPPRPPWSTSRCGACTPWVSPWAPSTWSSKRPRAGRASSRSTPPWAAAPCRRRICSCGGWTWWRST